MHNVRSTALTLVESLLVTTTTANLPFALRLLDTIKNDDENYLVYTGLWSLGLRQRFNAVLADLGSPSKSQALEWTDILIQASKDLTICAKQLMGLRLDNTDDADTPKYNSETVLRSIIERRKKERIDREKRERKTKPLVQENKKG
jgi:hypothetical protein